MNRNELASIRHYLGKSQSQLSRLLGVSARTVQSFEQGWRNIPPSAERQLLLLLSLKVNSNSQKKPCWEIRNCPNDWKVNCLAWEFKAGNFCWLINGTFCNGKYQENWNKKIELCRKCKVFKALKLDGVSWTD